jgi:hypothetical protein
MNPHSLSHTTVRAADPTRLRAKASAVASQMRGILTEVAFLLGMAKFIWYPQSTSSESM